MPVPFSAYLGLFLIIVCSLGLQSLYHRSERRRRK